MERTRGSWDRVTGGFSSGVGKVTFVLISRGRVSQAEGTASARALRWTEVGGLRKRKEARKRCGARGCRAQV